MVQPFSTNPMVKGASGSLICVLIKNVKDQRECGTNKRRMVKENLFQSDKQNRGKSSTWVSRKQRGLHCVTMYQKVASYL